MIIYVRRSLSVPVKKHWHHMLLYYICPERSGSERFPGETMETIYGFQICVRNILPSSPIHSLLKMNCKGSADMETLLLVSQIILCGRRNYIVIVYIVHIVILK